MFSPRLSVDEKLSGGVMLPHVADVEFRKGSENLILRKYTFSSRQDDIGSHNQSKVLGILREFEVDEEEKENRSGAHTCINYCPGGSARFWVVVLVDDSVGVTPQNSRYGKARGDPGRVSSVGTLQPQLKCSNTYC
jgi:hypothetical protein